MIFPVCVQNNEISKKKFSHRCPESLQEIWQTFLVIQDANGLKLAMRTFCLGGGGGGGGGIWKIIIY